MLDEVHDQRGQASVSAAHIVTETLAAQLKSTPEAGLVVSGGSTPVACFDALSGADVPWERVQVTLTDERSVPLEHPDSNQRLLRERLLIGRAASARFVPVERAALAAMPKPFACVLAGMGEDGHFASLFPDAVNLAQGLDLDNPDPCLRVSTAASRHDRVSMTLSQLVQAKMIVLLAFGEAKRRVLEAPAGLPVSRLLAQRRAPVRTIWAP